MDGKKSVLRAPDLETLTKVVCRLKDATFDLNKFRATYSGVSGRDIGEATAEDYFYTAAQIGLIKKKRNRYWISNVEYEILCDHLKNKRMRALNEILFNILKSKIEPFRNFLKFLEEPRSRSQLNDMFNPHSGGTMLRWGLVLGVVGEDKHNKKYFLLRKTREPIDTEKFWRVLEDVFEKQRKTGFVGVKSAFVRIPDLRETARGLLGMTRDDFDEYLRMLLYDNKYSHKIELSGAPIIYIEKELKKNKRKRIYKHPFSYKKKNYYFLAINK